MILSEVFLRKIKLQMRLVHIVEHRPRQKIKLQPISEQDFVISLDSVRQWSEDNFKLYQLILQNGMAEYICNKDFLFEFYQSLNFIEQQITRIDGLSSKFSSLKILNLVNNKITVIENIPQTCKELYLDFNQISSIKNAKDHHLQLLSVSHNNVTDKLFEQITKCFPELRCLNVGHNIICDLKQFVTHLASLAYLKILVAYQNPISMLKIYYSYITDHLIISYFDGTKYVKQQPPKPQPVKIEEKKEVKQEKKDAKKDNKKGAKVEEKPVQQPPKVQVPPPVVKRQLTSQDFQRVKINVSITNLEQHVGNSYDASLFPAELDPKKIQTCYWVKYKLMGKQFNQKQKMISYDNTVIEGDANRINLQCSAQLTFTIDLASLKLFNQGLKIEVCQVEPKMIKDPQTLQLKPEIKDNQVANVQSILGGVRIDFRALHLIKDRSLALKYRLFSADVSNNPFFYDPIENEEQIISAKKEELQRHLKKIEEQKIKKAEEEQLLKQQKKGKDQKKAADKKAGKKQGKDVVVQQKKKAQKCQFPVDKKLYVAIEQNKISKGKQLLCVQIKIQ